MKQQKFIKLASVLILIIALLISSTALAFADTTGKWIQRAPMTCSRDSFQTVKLNGKIFAISGINREKSPTEDTPTMEEYDPVTNTWTTKASMQDARNNFQAVQLNNKIYVIGGLRYPYTNVSSVEEYDPETNTWTPKKPLITTRCRFVAKVLNGKIYVMGGFAEEGPELSSTEVYDPATDTWSSCAQMLENRSSFSAEVVNDKIYVFGGSSWQNGHDQNLDSIEEYDPKTNKWTKMASMSAGRCALQTETLNGKIYIMGGIETTGNVSQAQTLVEEFDPKSNTCIKKTPMLHERYYFLTEIINGHIYAIGSDGTSTLKTESKSVEEYDPIADKWVEKASAPFESNSWSYQSNVINGNIYLLNGQSKTLVEYNENSSDPTLTITASPNKVKVGQQFTTNIAIHNETNICAEDIKVNYDKDLFEYEGATGQTGTKIYKEDTTTPGTVRFITACQGKDSAATGDKGLITLKFKAKAKGVGKVDIIKGRIADNATLEEDVAAENCGEDTITVDGYQDVNRSGNFTLLDLGIDAYYYGMNASDTDSTKYDADVIPDGKIDDNDLTQITQEILANKDYAPNN